MLLLWGLVVVVVVMVMVPAAERGAAAPADAAADDAADDDEDNEDDETEAAADALRRRAVQVSSPSMACSTSSRRWYCMGSPRNMSPRRFSFSCSSAGLSRASRSAELCPSIWRTTSGRS